MNGRAKTPVLAPSPVALLDEIRKLIDAARQRAEYGERIVATLSQQLVRDYGNRVAKRNISQFPDDSMFQFTSEDWENLRCQVGISNSPSALPGAKNLNSSQTVMRSRVAHHFVDVNKMVGPESLNS